MKSRIVSFSIATVLCFSLFTYAKGVGGPNAPEGSAASLDINEETHLKFMRAEEKLAHDVYLYLSNIYYGSAVFSNITQSETRHTNVMADKLTQFGLEDVNHDDEDGEFSASNYGDYFTEKYNTLIAEGEQNLYQALMVGGLIEELDMHDIVLCPTIIVTTDNGIGEDECGLDYTDNKALIKSYTHLLEGSENHLRAFVRQVESLLPEGELYEAQYLDQDTVDEILGR
jgi:hypothetical protein